MFQRNEQPLYIAQGSMIRAFAPGGEARQLHLLREEIEDGDQLIFASPTKYTLYRSGSRTVEEFDGAETVISVLPTEQPPEYLYLDQTGHLWVSNAEGTFRRPPGGDFSLFLPPLPEGRVINFFAEDEHGNMFFGCLDPVLKRITYLEKIIGGVRESANWVTDIEDRILTISGSDFQAGIRLNTYGGVYALDFTKPAKSPFRRFLYREILPGKFGDVMRGFTADDDGVVYANKDSKMPYWFRVHPQTDVLDTITMLKNDGSVVNHYGCGTNLLNYHGDIYGHSCDLDSTETYLGFVYRYRPSDESWKRWPLPEESQVVRWVANGRTDDELLLITEEKKYHLDGRLYYFYPERDSFALVRTRGPERAIKGYTKSGKFDDQRKALWFGTDHALYSFDFETEELRAYTFSDGRLTFITDIFIRHSGRLVLSTVNEGLQEFNPATGEFFKIGGFLREGGKPPEKDDFLKLPTDDIATLNLTDDDKLLITTFEGLVLYEKADSRTAVFTTDDGLNNDEFNTTSTFYNPADQRWYAGGVNGFVSFATDDLATSPSPYNPVMVSYRSLKGKDDFETIHALPSAPSAPVTIDPSVIYFAVDFSLPDYFPRRERRYQTKLVGLDPDWNAPTTNTSVRYTGLEPGTYTLLVRAFDGEGRKGEVERSLKINVLTPVYRRWWFILLVIVGVLLALYGMHRRRMAHLREKMEGERKVLWIPPVPASPPSPMRWKC